MPSTSITKPMGFAEIHAHLAALAGVDPEHHTMRQLIEIIETQTLPRLASSTKEVRD